MGFFSDIKGDISNMKKDYLGPEYEYHKKIKSPDELGMSGRGSLGALAADIAGIVNYVGVLVNGPSPASRVEGERALGNKFFLKTGGNCTDYKTEKLVPRGIYINNVPTGKIPIISDLTDMDFKFLRGLAPGVLSDLYEVNPVKLFRGFMMPGEPVCAEVKLEVIDPNDKISQGSGFIPIVELLDLEKGLMIPKGTVTPEMKEALRKENGDDDEEKGDEGKDDEEKENETFMNMCDIMNGRKIPQRKPVKKYKDLDPISNIYFISISFFMLYLILKLLKR